MCKKRIYNKHRIKRRRYHMSYSPNTQKTTLECDEVMLDCEEMSDCDDSSLKTPSPTIKTAFLSRNYALALAPIGTTPPTPRNHNEPLDDYKDDICANLFKKQSRTTIMPLSEFASNINAWQRRKVIDWLIDLSDDMKLRSETLFLAVNIFDRLLSTKSGVTPDFFQLFGAVSIWLAIQYEEVQNNDVQNKISINTLNEYTNFTYTKAEFKNAYRMVINHLGFEFTMPTVDKFMCHLDENFLPNNLSEQKILVEYILTASLMEADITLKYAPSTIASATMLLVRRLFHPMYEHGNPSHTLSEYNCARLRSEPSSPEEFTECVSALSDCALGHLDVLHESNEAVSPEHLTALNNKYRDDISVDVTKHVCERLYI